MSFKIHHQVNPETLILLEDQDLIAFACGSNIRIHRLSTCELLRILNESNNPIVLLFKQKDTLFALDNRGKLVNIDLGSFQKIGEADLEVEVQIARVSKNFEHLFIKPATVDQLYIYNLSVVLEGTIQYETIDLPAATEPTSEAFVEVSPDGRFVFYAVEKLIQAFSVNDASIVHKIKHNFPITCLTAQNNNEFIVVGDMTGKITYYYTKLDSKKQGKVVSSTAHWHAHSVTSLSLFENNTQLISGGEEGVLVFWHLITQNKTFCPRLGATISKVLLTEKNDRAIVLLSTNRIKVIKLQNFEEVSSINGITFESLESEKPADTYAKYPKSDVYAFGSAPGSIQFVNFTEFKKLSDFQVTKRNPVTKGESDFPAPLRVEKISFESSGRYMATYEKRNTSDTRFNINYLKFWDETELFDFTLNTSVEAVHGGNVTLLKSFTTTKTQECHFVSFGQDRLLQVWKRYRLATQSTGKGLGDSTHKYYWKTSREFSYKGLEITDVKYHDKWQGESKEILLIALAGQAIVLDFSNFSIISTFKTSTEKVPSHMICFDNSAGRVHLLNKTGIWCYNFDEQCFQQNIKILDICCHTFDEASQLLYIAAPAQKDQNQLHVVIEIDIRQYKILRVYSLPEQPSHLLLQKHNQSKTLIAITDAKSNYLIVLSSDKADNWTKRLLSSSQNVEVPTTKTAGRSKNLIQSSMTAFPAESLFNKKSFNVFDPRTVFHEKSHIMPPLKLLTSVVLGKMLEKIDSEVDSSNQPDLNLATDDKYTSNSKTLNEDLTPESLTTESESTHETFPKELIRKKLAAVKQLYKKTA